MLNKIKFLTAGESHGKALVGIIQGIPAGLEISSKYINVPIYPSITRDLSLTLLKSVEIKNILLNIKKFATDLLEDIKLYDIYEGDQIDKNSKSVTFQLIFRSNDKTLVDIDVDKIMDKIILEASSTLNAKLR